MCEKRVPACTGARFSKAGPVTRGSHKQHLITRRKQDAGRWRLFEIFAALGLKGAPRGARAKVLMAGAKVLMARANVILARVAFARPGLRPKVKPSGNFSIVWQP